MTYWITGISIISKFTILSYGTLGQVTCQSYEQIINDGVMGLTGAPG